MKKSLIALAFGTFGLGIAEFMMMAILPNVAKDMDIDIATAGTLISAYSAGVGVGALFLIVARKFQLKHILLALICIVILGNLCASMAPNYWTILLSQLISGLPHGAFFGVGAIVAEKLSDKGKSTQAVSIMMTGMMFANLLGVPLATALGTYLSWRIAFLLIGSWGILVLLLIYFWIPKVKKLSDTQYQDQFSILKKPAPWLILVATMMGNAAIFCWYSYINPLLTEVSGFTTDNFIFLMMLAGAGMVIGNIISGWLSDKFTPESVAKFTQAIICIVLLSIFFVAEISWMSAILMFLGMAAFSALTSPEQVLFLRQFRGAEMLGMTCVQIGFSLGSSLGTSFGGISLEIGYGYQYPALIGSGFALVGFFIMTYFVKTYKQ